MVEPYRAHRLKAANWGYQGEAGLHAVRLIMAGVLDRFTGLQIVVGHGGEGVPYWLSRIDRHPQAHSSVVPSLQKLPSESLRSNFPVTSSEMISPEVLDYCLAVLGSDRMMFAIAYPYEQTRDAAELLAGLELAAEHQARVLGNNASRLFHISRRKRDYSTPCEPPPVAYKVGTERRD